MSSRPAQFPILTPSATPAVRHRLMAEVFGVVAGIVGVLDVGAKVSEKLIKARKTWKYTASELSVLQADLEYFRLVLNELQNAWGSLQSLAKSDVLNAIPGYMAEAEVTLADLERLIDSFSDLTERKRKTTWLVQKSIVESKTAELGKIRARVWEVLQICGTCVTIQDHFETITYNARLQKLEAAVFQPTRQVRPGFVNAEESEERDPDPAPSSIGPVIRKTDIIPDISPSKAPAVTATKYFNPESLCDGICACCCHEAPFQYSRWATPKMLSGLIGVLRGSTKWVPRWTSRCSVSTCLRQTKSEYRLQFELPRWIAIHSFDALVQRRLGQPPTFLLRYRPRVDNIWFYLRFQSRDRTMISSQVQQTPDCVHFRNSEGASPLIYIATTAKHNLGGISEILLRAGADLYAQNDAGISAAALIATRYLLHTWEPFELWPIERALPMARIIDELNLSPVSRIMLDLSQRDFHTTLINLPPWHTDLSEPDATGYTPIHWAAMTVSSEAVGRLASQGVDVNTKGSIGHTPLVMLCDFLTHDRCRIRTHASKGVFDTIEALLKAGADTEATNKYGRRPIELACLNIRRPGWETQEIIKLLIKHGANTHLTDRRGNTLMHIVVSSTTGSGDDVKKLSLLLDHGLNPNAQNNLGETPFMNAIMRSDTNICRLLAEKGAHFELVTTNGQTIFHCAAKCWKESTLKLLIDVLPPGIKVGVDTIDDKGRTAEDVFVETWCTDGEWSKWMDRKTRACFKQLISSRRYLDIDLTGWWDQWEQEHEQEEEEA